ERIESAARVARVGILDPKSGRERGQLGLCRADRYRWPKSGDDGEVMIRGVRRITTGIEIDRRPRIGGRDERIDEARRHDPGNAIRRAVHRDRAADRRRIAAIFLLPETVADHGDARWMFRLAHAAVLVVARERAA